MCIRDRYPVLDTVIMGNARLYEIMKEKEVIYALSLIHISRILEAIRSG